MSAFVALCHAPRLVCLSRPLTSAPCGPCRCARLCPSTVEKENEEEKQKAAASQFDVDASHPIDVITANRDDVILPFRTYLNHASSVRRPQPHCVCLLESH